MYVLLRLSGAPHRESINMNGQLPCDLNPSPGVSFQQKKSYSPPQFRRLSGRFLIKTNAQKFSRVDPDMA